MSLVERVDGLPALQPQGGPSPVADALAALLEAGFVRTPRGLRLR